MSWTKDGRNPASQASRKQRGGMVRDRRTAAASKQISSDQLVAEAFTLNQDVESKQRPEIMITNKEELELYRQKTRKDHEDKVKRSGPISLAPWLRYAHFEEQQKDLTAARSIFERAIDHHGTGDQLWRNYAELEIRARNMNGVRAVMDRAVASLPTCEPLWLKYILIERAAMNITRARDLLNRWLSVQPLAHAWKLAIQFELEVASSFGVGAGTGSGPERVRELLGKFAVEHNEADTWLYYAHQEVNAPELNNNKPNTDGAERGIQVLETALKALKHPYADCRIITALAELLETRGEYEGARELFLDAMNKCPAEQVRLIVLPAYTAFEKAHGDKETIEAVLLSTKVAELEAILGVDAGEGDAAPSASTEENEATTDDSSFFTIPKKNQAEVWSRYISIVEYLGDYEKVARIYERSLSSGPFWSQSWAPEEQQKAWEPWVSLWSEFAAFMMSHFNNPARAAGILREIIMKVPKGVPPFPIVWTTLAEIELWERKSLTDYRKVMGNAVGKNPSRDIFNFYIATEQKIAQVLKEDPEYFSGGVVGSAAAGAAATQQQQQQQNLPPQERIRKLYGMLVSHFGDDPSVWIEFSKWEMVEGGTGIEGAETILSEGLETEHVLVRGKEELHRQLVKLKIKKGDIQGARECSQNLAFERYIDVVDEVSNEDLSEAEKRENLLKFHQAVDTLIRFELHYCEGGKESGIVKQREWFSTWATHNRKKRGVAAAKPFLDAWRRFEQRWGNAETQRKVEDAAEAPLKKKQKFLDRATAKTTTTTTGGGGDE